VQGVGIPVSPLRSITRPRRSDEKTRGPIGGLMAMRELVGQYRMRLTGWYGVYSREAGRTHIWRIPFGDQFPADPNVAGCKIRLRAGSSLERPVALPRGVRCAVLMLMNLPRVSIRVGVAARYPRHSRVGWRRVRVGREADRVGARVHDEGRGDENGRERQPVGFHGCSFRTGLTSATERKWEA
jgi:hypothetical protein